MVKLRVISGFSTTTDLELADLSGRVISGLFSNGAFPAPPVSLEMLVAARQALIDAVAAQGIGGKLATATKNARREELAGLLRQLASYVQSVCKDDRSIVLSSGFETSNTTRSQTELVQPQIVSVNPLFTTQLRVRVKSVPNAKSYEAQIRIGAGDWMPGGLFTQARVMKIIGLIPGTVYTVRVRAIGGTTGFSEWSAPISHMSM